MADQDDGFKEVPNSQPAWTSQVPQSQPPQGGYQAPQSGYQPAQSGYQPQTPVQGTYQAPQSTPPAAQGGYRPPQGYTPPPPQGSAATPVTPPTSFQPGQTSFGQPTYGQPPKKKGLPVILIVLLALVAVGCLAVVVVAAMLLSGKWEFQLLLPLMTPFI